MRLTGPLLFRFPRDGLKSVAKILILALILDAINQIVVLHWFYLDEDLLVAQGLAFVPLLLIRGQRIGLPHGGLPAALRASPDTETSR